GDRFAVLTDIQGIEDALGDMDFKVAGTAEGVTALQMDIKIRGVSREVLQEALAQARAGRLFILEKMAAAIDRPRADLSPYAPRILTMQIPVDKIRDVIGPGGKMIRKIIEQTGVEIDVEDDGRVFIASTDPEAGKRAMAMIDDLTREIEVGAVYTGKVKRITNFGAFVEILPGKEGLVHISKLAPERVGKVEDVVGIGDEVTVRVTEIDRLGRINLSRKDVLPPSGANGGAETDGRERADDGRPRAGRGERGGRRGEGRGERHRSRH
ncbi:MAG TPA: S1 RNA-binding domain-containing protein, partial [Limnochordia bacterium]